MNLFLKSAESAVKKYLNLPLCIVLFVYTSAVSAYALYSGINEIPPVDIGVLTNSPEKGIFERFAEDSKEVINVVGFSDLDLLKSEVLKNKIQAGYVFGGGEIEIYLTRRARSTAVINLLLSGISVQSKSGEYGYAALRPLLEGFDRERTVADIQRRSDEYLENSREGALEIIHTKQTESPLVKSENSVYLFVHIFFWTSVFAVLAVDSTVAGVKNLRPAFAAMKVNMPVYYAGSLAGSAVTASGFFALSALILRFV